MEQYTLQSYFKSLCNSFYIAYAEKKRLEKKLEEADLTVGEKALKEAEKARLKDSVFEINKKYYEQESAVGEWAERLINLESMLWKDLVRISRNKQKIIVTSKEEVYAIMYVYAKDAAVPRVLNIEEQYLMSFPKDDKLCSSFLTVYLGGDEGKIKKFCKENI